MEIVNVKELEEQIYRKGFSKGMVEEVVSQAKQGLATPAIYFEEALEKDKLAYTVHFRVHHETFKAYLNSFDLTLTSRGEVRTHTFSSHHKITAREGYRMLKFGDLVAVNKDLYNKENEKYNVWIQLDLSGPKDVTGNYPLKTFHQNYYQKQPFDLRESLIELIPVFPNLKMPGDLEKFEKKLKKAYLLAATGQLGEKKIPLLISVNPQGGLIEVYDRTMVLLNNKPEFEKQLQTSIGTSQQSNKGLKP